MVPGPPFPHSVRIMDDEYPLLGMMVPSPSQSMGGLDIDTSIFGIETAEQNLANDCRLLDDAFAGLEPLGIPAAADEIVVVPPLMRPTQPMFSYQNDHEAAHHQHSSQSASRPAMTVDQPLLVVPRQHPQQHGRIPGSQHSRTPESGGGKPLAPLVQQLQFGGDENKVGDQNQNTRTRSKKRGRPSSSGGGAAACAAGGVKRSASCNAGKKTKMKSGGSAAKQKGKQRRKIDTSALGDENRRALIRMFTKEALRAGPEEWRDVHRPRVKMLSSMEVDFISELRRSELSCVYAERQRQRKLSKMKSADDEIRALRIENKRLRDQIAAMEAKYQR